MLLGTAQVQEGQPYLLADPGSVPLVILAHLVIAIGRYAFDGLRTPLKRSQSTGFRLSP